MPRLGYSGNVVSTTTPTGTPGTILDTADMGVGDRLLEVAGSLYLFDATGGAPVRARNIRSVGATDNGIGVLAAAPVLFNGSSYDQQLNNRVGTLLASAVRSANTSSAAQVNYNGKAVTLFLNVTVNPGGAETLIVRLRGVDPVSGVDTAYYQSAAQLGAGGTGLLIFQIGPGVISADGVATSGEYKGLYVVRNWLAQIVHSAAGNWTYSLGYAIN